MAIQQLVVAVLPNGFEYYDSIKVSDTEDWRRIDYTYVCEEVVRRSGLVMTAGGSPIVIVRLYRLTNRDGILVRDEVGNYSVDLPPDPMTAILALVPEEFHSFLIAVNRQGCQLNGHETGLKFARLSAAALVPCIERYRTNLTHEIHTALGNNS